MQEVELVEVRRSGFVTFVGVIALVIGVYNAVAGIAAIREGRPHRSGREGPLRHRHLGVGLDLARPRRGPDPLGGLILTRHPTGLVLGVTWAAITAAMTVFVIFVYPIWALIILGVDILIIWGLIENADEFG